MSKIRVLIVDDQKLFAGAMKIVLEEYRDEEIEVVGIAYDGSDAVAKAEDDRPDVVLMDVRMPGMDGVQATRAIHASYPDMKIVMLTTFDDDAYVHDALAAGAVGYLLKDLQPEALVAAVQSIYSGTFLVSSSVGKKIISVRDRDTADKLRDDSEIVTILAHFRSLTRREAEVLRLLSRSYDNHEIAEKLFIAEQTVKNYTSTIYAKLGVDDRMHATRLARSCLDGSVDR